MSELIGFCPACKHVMVNCRYSDIIRAYYDEWRPLPDDIHDITRAQKLTIQNISRAKDIPIAAAYRARNFLELVGDIQPYLGGKYLLNNGHSSVVYEITPKGRQYAAALRIFQQSVEAIR